MGVSFFFFNDTATTEIYTLSLHDALPISVRMTVRITPTRAATRPQRNLPAAPPTKSRPSAVPMPATVEPLAMSAKGRRSEEHTSELQSQSNLVCRLLLEKKKTHSTAPPPH